MLAVAKGQCVMRSVLFFVVEVFALVSVVVTVAVRLIGNNEAVWEEMFKLGGVVLSKRSGEVFTETTVLFTRLRANEGAIRAQEPKVCFGIAWCDRNIDVADAADVKGAPVALATTTLLLCIEDVAVEGNFADRVS